MAKMDERLESMVARYHEINDLMMRSDIVSNRKEMAKLGREQNELTPIVETYGEYKTAKADLEDAQSLLHEDDKEMREMAESEVERLEPLIQEYLDKLELLLVPKDPNDSHNAILKFAELPAEMKEISLREICSGCMRNTRKRKAGNWRSSIRKKAKRVVIR